MNNMEFTAAGAQRGVARPNVNIGMMPSMKQPMGEQQKNKEGDVCEMKPPLRLLRDLRQGGLDGPFLFEIAITTPGETPFQLALKAGAAALAVEGIDQIDRFDDEHDHTERQHASTQSEAEIGKGVDRRTHPAIRSRPQAKIARMSARAQSMVPAMRLP